MASAFVREAARSIRGSLGRFLAIMGIAALGCGFYAGLQMCGPDMRAAADALYDGCGLYDLRVVSTLGWTDADIARLSAIEGVSDSMPAISLDAMARLRSEQMAVRVSSLAVEAAAASSETAADSIAYAGSGYLNRIFLRQGRWPQAAGECVLDADKNQAGLGIGDTIELLYGASDLDGVLRERRLEVVGLVSSPAYPYTGSFGSTTLGSGMIGEYLFCAPAAFEADAPYTEAFLAVEGADALASESDAYLEAVEKVGARIEEGTGALASARLSDVRSDAQADLDDARAEYEDARGEADAELADARRELADAAAELADAQRSLIEGQADYDDGLAELAASRAEAERKLAEAQATIDARQAEADAGAAELAAGRAELAEQRRALEAGTGEFLAGVGAESLDAVPGAIGDVRAQAEAGRARLDAAIAQIEAAPDAARAGIDEAEAGIDEAEAGIAQAREGIAAAEAALELLAARREETLALKAYAERQLEEAVAAQAQLPALREQLAGLKATEEQLEAAIAGASKLERPALEEQLAAADAGIANLSAAIAEIEAAPDAARAGIDEAEAGVREIDAGIDAAQAGKTAAEAALAEAEAGSQRAQAGKAEAQAGLDRALAAQAQLPSLKAQRAEVGQALKRLDEAEAAAASLKDARAQLEAAEGALAQGAAELASGQSALDDGKAELARQRAEAEAQLAAAQATLDEAAAQLADGRAQLADGRAAYADGMAEYEAAYGDAQSQLADAKAEIDDAQRKIDDLEPPELYVLNRTQSEGAATYHADTERMDSLGGVFPLIFFLVAALVSLTTMTRMVEDDRILIGTYKALGYSTPRIAGKYLAYAGIASAAGAVIGTLALSQIIPFVVTSAYSIIYTVPLHPLPLPIDLPIALTSGLVGVCVTLAATWAAVVATLREVPATLMLPRAPAAGKRIFLERVRPLWTRLSFSWKVTFRNLFRYKRRFFMTVVGISGCTALLLVGFGLHDAIWDIIDCQYGPIIHYDTTVALDADALAADADAVEGLLGGTGGVSGIARVQQENMRAGVEGGDTLRVSVVIPRDAEAFGEVVTLRERVSRAKIAFGPDAVVITEKLANKYGIAAGDRVVLFEQDATGNVRGEGHALVVDGVAENYVGSYVYLGRDAWRSIEADEPPFQTIYASTSAEPQVRSQVAALLRDANHVSTVIFSDESINLYRSMLSVVDMVVVLLIVCAGALAAIVLYNLTNINIAERVREIASLKVLGFTKREVYAYIFREIALLAVIGDVLGLLLGSWLENFVVVTAEVDYVMFGRAIHPESYAISFAVTLGFTAIILFLMRGKLDRVNMVESLKSVD